MGGEFLPKLGEGIVGARFDDRLEIVEGLKPHEPVAVAHSYPLKSALLISRLGAGCADD